MKARVNISLYNVLLDRARIEATNRGMALSQYISMLIYNDLNAIEYGKVSKSVPQVEEVDNETLDLIDNILCQ